MRAILRRAAAVGAGAAACLAIAALSQVPYAPEPASDALVRLSWRARAERIEHCRELTDAEQENLPAHMRQRRACEGRNALYRLRLEVDGTRVLEEPAQGSGARQRRPILVFHELRLRPGLHHILVELTRDRAAGEDDDQTGRDRDRAPQKTELPASLDLSTRVALDPRSVMLVTYDPDRRKLVARTGEEVPGD